MKIKTIAITVASLLLTIAVSAFAEEHGEGGHMGTPVAYLIYGFINFAIFLGLIIFLAKNKVNDFYKSRAQEARAMVTEAQKLLAEAKALNDKARVRKDALDREVDSILKTTEEGAKRQADEIVSQAKVQAQRLVETAKATVEAETLKAIEEIRGGMVEKTMKMAEERIKSKIDSSHQRALVGEYLNKLEEVN